MNKIQIDATERTPSIVFDFDKNHFSISGESYPENTAEFYGDIISQFGSHLKTLNEAEIVFNFSLVYFNSSSSKVVMRFFEDLEQAAERKNIVIVNWYYEEDDDHMKEMGEEFSEDLESTTFNLLPRSE